MFNSIAPRYDLINHLFSLQIDRSWRRKAMRMVEPTPAMRLLDVACGTGDFAMAAYDRGVRHVVGIDISGEMVEVGRLKVADRGLSEAIQLCEGDSEQIDHADGSFDVVTVGFGVRNFEHLEVGMREMCRVLKPGGKAIVLEFSMPRCFVVRWAYLFYFRCFMPFVAGLISGNKQAYEYLPDSVMKFPHGDAFLEVMKRCGYVECAARPVSLGIATIYTAIKP